MKKTLPTRMITLSVPAVAYPATAPDALQLEVLPIPLEARPAIESSQTGHVVADPSWYTWCPSVYRDPAGVYHMFHARWPKKMGFGSWITHSEIIHATSDRPEGPYAPIDCAIPPSGEDRGGWFTALNSKIHEFDGTFFLYFVQTRGTDISDEQRVEIAKVGHQHPKWKTELRPNQRTFVAKSPSLSGPWKISSEPIIEPAKTISTLTVNPAVCRGPDGTYFMIIKGDKPNEPLFILKGDKPSETRSIRNQALATAPSPEGPWTIMDKPVIDYLDTEDMSMWYDTARKRFYAVFHAHSFIGMVTSADGYTWEKAANWHLTDNVIRFVDGTTWKPDNMERPFVMTDMCGCPTHLIVTCKRGNMSANIILPLRIISPDGGGDTWESQKRKPASTSS